MLENLQFFAELFDVSPKDMAERIERLLTFVDMMEFKKRRVANLPGSFQKKLALVCTLIHAPEILLLDEPTSADPIPPRVLEHSPEIAFTRHNHHRQQTIHG